MPPAARIDVVREERFGIFLTDPYRWMEAEDQELAGWPARASTLPSCWRPCRGVRRCWPGFRELTSAAAADSAFTPAGERMFFLRQPPGGGVPVLMADDRILLDPSMLTGVGHWNLDWFVPSPDACHVACGLSQGGSEQSTLRVLDVGTGGLLPDTLSGAFLGAVNWLPEGDALLCHRYRDPEPGASAHRRRQDSRACLHRLGTPADEDLVVLARGLNPAVRLSPADRPFVFARPGSDWLVAVIAHGTLTIPVGDDLADCSFYVAPRAALADPEACPWQLVAGSADGVVSYALHGDDMYLVTYRDAARLRVDRVSLADFTAVTVVPAGERVVVAVRVAGDELLVHERDAGLSRLRRVPLAGGKPAAVPLPVNGALDRWAVHPSRPEVFFTLSSRTSPPQAYRYVAGTVADTGWLPPSPPGFGDVVTADLRVSARDGTLIPLRVTYRAGLTLDGTAPAILAGYGSFGVVPGRLFAPEMLAWYERGGIVADAGLRGGEFGREWHEAGRGPRKITTITDFIDCAEYLIARGYTSARRLAGRGGSAGAIPVGGALVRRPDLFGAIVLEVPSVNKTRSAGAGNVGEFGSAATEEGLRDLLAIDGYQNVTSGTCYPAVLLTAGVNDPRVAVWHPAKMAARLQAATTSGRPVLLRIDPDAGHGYGSMRAQHDELIGDIFAFLLHELT
jgi:prolyl oligopeptidase